MAVNVHELALQELRSDGPDTDRTRKPGPRPSRSIATDSDRRASSTSPTSCSASTSCAQRATSGPGGCTVRSSCRCCGAAPGARGGCRARPWADVRGRHHSLADRCARGADQRRVQRDRRRGEARSFDRRVEPGRRPPRERAATQTRAVDAVELGAQSPTLWKCLERPTGLETPTRTQRAVAT